MKTKLIFLAVVSTLLGLSPLAHAATRTWDGGGADNLWTNAANWGGTAPIAGDNLVFPGTAPADSLASTNNFANGTTFGSITITGANADTCAGTTTVNGGTLLLNKSPSVMAIPGAGHW